VTRNLLAVAAALAVAGLGCADKPKPPPAAKVAAAAPAPAPAPAAAAEEAKKPAEAEWSYSSVGKRDPFRSFLAEANKKSLGISPCSTPLGRFELEQLKLVAVITGLEDPIAMVQAPGGVGYSVRRGACIGKNGGTVSAVRTGEIVVAEWAIRADGTRDRTQTVISLPKREPLNLEE
jgi:type IV pilus assembly protein PilP